MANTVAQLLQRQGVTEAYILEFEGIPTLFTSDPDSAGISTAWGGTHTVKSTLEIPQSISRSLDILGHNVEEIGWSLEILDTDGAFAALLAEADSSAAYSNLTVNADRDDTTINVKDTSVLPAVTGTAYAGHERFTYAGKGATTLTGCTRGTFGYAGKTNWAHTHKIGVDGYGPEVASKQRVWKGRGVTVYRTAKDPDTGLFVPKADCLKEFVGFLMDFEGDDSEGARWRLSLVSIESRLRLNLMRDQFRAKFEGFTLAFDETWQIREASVLAAGTPGAYTFVTKKTDLTIPAGTYSLETLKSAVNALFEAKADSAALTFRWSLSIKSLGNSNWRVEITQSGVFEQNVEWKFDLVDITTESHPDVASGVAAAVLGIASVGTPEIPAGVFFFAHSFTNLDATATMTAHDLAPLPPIQTFWDPNLTAILPVTGATGTWNSQLPGDNPGGPEPAAGYGFLRISDALKGADISNFWIVTYNSGTQEFTRIGNYGIDGRKHGWVGNRLMVYKGDPSVPEVKQVWISEGSIERHICRMLISTGTTDYNYDGSGTNHDKWPDQMGLGIPSTIVDTVSVHTVAGQMGDAQNQRIVIADPIPAVKELVSFCMSLGFYLTWRNGKITAVSVLSVAGRDAEFTLDDSNTGSDFQVGWSSGAEFIRNEWRLLYNRNPFTDDYRNIEVYHHTASQYEHDISDSFDYEARSLYDFDGTRLSAWRENVAGPLAAYFGRAIRKYRVTGCRALQGLSVGDVVTITRKGLPDAVTGLYTLSSVKCWVISFTYDPQEREFTEIILLRPLGNAYPLAPSGILDYDRGDFGYDGATSLTLRSHDFSRSTEAVDATRFKVGDVIRIVEVDPANPAAPDTWIRTVASQGSIFIGISAALAAPAFSTAKRYYVELDDYDSAVAALATRAIGLANTVAFVGDDADDAVQNHATPRTIFHWGIGAADSDDDTPVGTERYRRLYDIADDDGEPFSVHKVVNAAHAVNNAWVYTNVQKAIDAMFTADRGVTGTTYGAIHRACIQVPPGCVTITLTIWGRFTGLGTLAKFRGTASPTPPHGTVAAPTFGPDISQVEGSNVTSGILASYTISLPLLPADDGRCYVTIEGKSDNANGNAIVRGICASFAPRTF